MQGRARGLVLWLLPRLLTVGTFLGAAPLAGCGPSGHGRPVHPAERVTAPSPQVSEDAFAAALRDLLASEPQSAERKTRLEGVVARQMSRVADRFRARERDRAVASLAGAMALVRTGELSNEVLGPDANRALEGAAEELARHGDEGRARAVYELLSRIAPPARKADIKAHLDAIGAWTRDTAGGGPLQIAGALEAAAVTRHVLEPSREARDEAVLRTNEFIDKALALRAARRARGQQISREEGMEAVRALETGATVLAAIHVRNGDARAALAAIDKPALREIARPELATALEKVVEKPDADRWLDVARLLRPGARRGEEEDFTRDADMLKVASFVAACEAYRFDTTSTEAAAVVGIVLVELGMGDAAPAVIADAVKAQGTKDPRLVTQALGLTMQAMARELEAEDPDGARRVFVAAAPLLALADAAKGTGTSAAARPYAMMGEIEVREGHLAEARKLLEGAVTRERNGSALLTLARIDHHEGKADAALERLREALATDDAAKDAGLRAEILVVTSDVLRERGETDAARKPLETALREVARALKVAEHDEKARLERLAARALDRFGARASAAKALLRALEATPRDKRQAAATIGQMAARAYLAGDLEGARDAVGRGLALELGREDLVYYAAWLHALEAEKKAKPDGQAERVLGPAADDPRWIGKVAAFVTGKVKAAELSAAARTPAQSAEALFYRALERRAAGDTRAAEDGFRAVIGLPAIDLLETTISKDLLAGPRATIGGPVPEVGLP